MGGDGISKSNGGLWWRNELSGITAVATGVADGAFAFAQGGSIGDEVFVVIVCVEIVVLAVVQGGRLERYRHVLLSQQQGCLCACVACYCGTVLPVERIRVGVQGARQRLLSRGDHIVELRKVGAFESLPRSDVGIARSI